MKKTLLIPLVLLILTVSCRNPFGFGEQEKTEYKKADLLDSILARKKIIALTDYSPNTFFIYRGERLGYQYELLQAFAKYLGVSVDLHIEANLDSSFQILQDRKSTRLNSSHIPLSRMPSSA